MMDSFRHWLQAQGKTKATIKETVLYARKYWRVLDTGDAYPILILSPRNKHHAMTALANYAKFIGRYDQFLQLWERYSLKWSKGDSLQAFERFFNEEITLETMLERIRGMIDKTPAWAGKIFKFACLIGLRASEVIECVNLLTSEYPHLSYYNPKRQALEHFRYPAIFMQQTKKAYISFVTEDILPVGIPTGLTYDEVRYACFAADIRCDMRFARKIFASWLRKAGIQAKVVDLLQGRVPPSVLTRHYLVPDQHYKEDVLKALKQLEQRL